MIQWWVHDKCACLYIEYRNSNWRLSSGSESLGGMNDSQLRWKAQWNLNFSEPDLERQFEDAEVLFPFDHSSLG